MRNAKGQVISIDMTISAIIFIIVICSTIILFQRWLTTQTVNYETTIFTRLETMENSFIGNGKIDEDKLDDFKRKFMDSSDEEWERFKKDLLKNTEFHSESCEVCLFFMNRDNEDTIRCSNSSSPCESYKNSHAFTKPVLREREFMNLFVIVCEK
ncbi:hypothetical protein JXA85_06170 [Candidatus Woesearchaeota archaeon]|nr:hypothetical protein [Candidatus Woesearchaeota archaeon]